MKMKIKKNDMVKVLYGKDAGKEGKILKVFTKEGKVLVEGLNMYKRHVKGDGKNKQSEVVDIVKPMNISKVMLICPSCKKSTRVSIERSEKEGRKRVCKKCAKKIDVVIKDEPVKKEKNEKTNKKKAKK